MGTPHSRAKLLSHMCEHVASETLALVGDIVDLTYMLKRETWKFGGAWHRQVLAHFLRKANQGEKVEWVLGNHETPIRDKTTHSTHDKDFRVAHRNMSGRSLYGINFMREAEHEVVPGFLL
ncbi:MAG TPA: hypothetical protein VFR09_00975, partial [Alphaproteobacteria bacterium]|nr:hypothetical protein [Alphaproteobacteria bacterium]